MKTLFRILLLTMLFSKAYGQLTIAGPTEGCIDITYTYSISGGTTAPQGDTWTFKLPVGATLIKDGFTWKTSTPGTYKLEVTLTKVHPLPHDVLTTVVKSNVLTVVIDAIPVIPSVIKGEGVVCGLSKHIYAIDPIPNADSYDWKLPNGMYINKTDNQYDTYIEFIDGLPQSGTLMVRGVNECGVGDYQLKNVALNQRPLDATVISGNDFVCENTKGYNYSVPKTDDIKTYCWTCLHDPIFHVTPSVNNASIDIGIDTSKKTSPYPQVFTVKLENECGATVISKTVSVNKIPTKPIKIQGQFDIIDLTVNYIYTTVSDYSKKVNWTIVPSNAANQIFDKSGNNDSLILNINKTYSGQIKIIARGGNDCGNSLETTEAFINILPKPEKCSTPDGDINVCVNKDNTYSTKTNFANTYEWELTPSNAGNLTVNLDKCQIDWNNNFNGAVSLRVRGINVSGQGEWSNYSNIVVYSLPTKPLTPSGDLILCINSPSSTYTTGASFATTYEWELNPAAAGVIFNNNQNAVINWENTYVGKAYLRVKAINGCGTGEWSEFTEITISNQALPPIINGNFSPCAGETVIYNSSSSDSIIWEIAPPNAYINYKVLSKNQIEITWNRDNLISSKAALKTYSKSNCGISTVKIDSVFINRFSIAGSAPVLLSTIKPFYCSSDSTEIIFSNTNQLLWFSNNVQFATGYKNTINFNTGIKQIVVTSILPNNCYSTSKIVNFNIDEVKADFSTSATQINVGGMVDFKNTSIGGSTYEWDFGDNSFVSTLKDDYHYYYNKGIYTVKLTAISANKCTDVNVKSNLIKVGAVSVEEFEPNELTVYPNPFTNTINLDSNFPGKYTVTITDVLGHIVFTNDTNIKNINTEEIPSGVYFIKVESLDKSKSFKLVKL